MTTYQRGWRDYHNRELGRICTSISESVERAMEMGGVIAEDADCPEPPIVHHVIEFTKVPKPEPSKAHMLADAVEAMFNPTPTVERVWMSNCCGAEPVGRGIEEQRCPSCSEHCILEHVIVE